MDHQDTQREWLLELLAWWEGEISPGQLAKYWQVSRQYASQQIKRYYQQNPGSLEYHSQNKCHYATDAFEPRHLTRQVNEYLDWATLRAQPQRLITATNHNLPHEYLQHPPRHTTPEIIRPLVKAMRNNYRLDVDYISLSHPDDQGRIIVPHHFVHTGQRWHLRAWCEKSQAFRDFVLSRFRGKPELLDKSDKTAAQDEHWNIQVTLHLKPDPRLTPEQQQVLAEDYQMQNGELHITTRGCLVNYLLKNLQLHPHIVESEPQAQQLVIVNKDDIKPWLFG